ncbi:dickkopf-related protein 3-like [Styela clava]
MKIITTVLVFLLLKCTSVSFAYTEYDEAFDEDLYERMLPDDDIMLSRRREDPVLDEEYWKDNEIDANGNRFSLSTNMDGDVQSIILYNGIDINKLPANYHNTTTITKKVGNTTVSTTVKIDKTTDPKTGAVSVSVMQSSNEGVPLNQCSASSPCKKGMYCRKQLVGDFCRKCSNKSKSCTSNEQCCGADATGSLCVRGTCQTGFSKGQAGTLCKFQSDCNTGLCCARKFLHQNGECQNLAKKDEKCAVSYSELSTIMRGGLCPCKQGLVCSSGSWLEGFFGGSMNTLLGGNTCRLPRKIANHWPFGFDNEDDDEDFEDILE